MSKPVDTGAPNTITQAFGSDFVVVQIASILPVKSIEKTAKSSHKYRQIAASIREMGLVEPPVVIQDTRDPGSYLLLDGHLRIEVLRDLGESEVECLVSTDDEAFTYNKRISRLSPIQEQRMIAKAIERNVPKDKIARALDINVRSIARKAQLLDGICEEVVGLLKDRICPLAVFDVLRKMSPLRQIEAAELLINANNFSVSYAAAILAGTPQAQLVTPQTPKRLKGMTAEAIARMERELSRLQEAISSIQDSYGQDHLHLTVVKGYLRKLITNDRVARYLEQYQPELFIEFQKIAEMTSTLPSEAA
ncbi:ParB N-terminal domain-containing protein [Bradyrhizobium manausense]|uniref:plasmid partitioning protein RepB C-terminal domain-containing protein n=1 Tax=Bradyrhizobium TaxID=374 RepID=UPI001BA669C7|nr:MULTISPECIES: plasmid partitioning protein RepB C-terminal domain-containing protein [Bradyrhizobium]MBR0831457.1 ParB N-terminal domain-containing protein [Bradyrhizobium manausense]UVO27085.1 ParB N-terminal domain-containing protein [Bradyrhizobium arachidis]